MAEMIPDRLPKRASAGEKKVFAILQRLPDDFIVYYEPMVDDLYPDFVIICPDLGLLIIEVKGWRMGDIMAADSQTVLLKEFGKEVRRIHPVLQARDHMLSLMEKCQDPTWRHYLVRREGEFMNRFVFPFSSFAIFPYITTDQLGSFPQGDLIQVFPPQKVVTKEILDQWDEESNADHLVAELRAYFDPIWDFRLLTKLQVKVLRAIIHPEILIDRPNATDELLDNKPPEDLVDLKILDIKQEQNARNIGEGHRIIYGVAGSGKTLLLLIRARLLSQQDPEAEILVLCYNLTLSAYLRNALQANENVNVFHFDGWSKQNKVTRFNQENDDSLGERLFDALQKGEAPDSRKYDAVLIDESQDFSPSWFKCVLEAMKEPEDGDLVIVGDGNQGLYKRGKIRWSEIGISARGRTISAKFDLDINYRNTRQILELAGGFANSETTEADEDGIRSLAVDPVKSPRTGVKPVLIRSSNKADECSRVLKTVKNLLAGSWFGTSIPPLKPQQIAILYPRLSKRNEDKFRSFINTLEKDAASVTWLTEKGNTKARTQISEDSIKIQTIHSAKGLQYRAVILLWADDLPSTFEDSDEQTERQLFYVGLTRPEEYLVISYSGQSPFIAAIEQSGHAVLT